MASDSVRNLTFFDLASGNALLGHLSRPVLDTLLRHSSLVEIDDNHRLINQGAASDAAYLLVDGEVDVLIENSYGSVHLTRLSAGALFGEIGVFTGLARNASVAAHGHVRVLKFGREDILTAGNASPGFLRSIMSTLGRQLSTYYGALTFFENALTAIEQRNFNLGILNDLMFPVPELINFSQTFRRFAEQIMLRQAHNKDMDSAAAIQRAFLPDPILMTGHASNLDIYADMRPAKEVGGDLYDFFFIGESRLAITIGDVVGKGIPAALFMAVTQSAIRLALRQDGHLYKQIKAANELLVSYNRETLFVTLFCGVIDLSTGILTYCNCGHNPPLLVHRDRDRLERLKLSGMPLALDSGVDYSSHEIRLASGDCLVLFTDGITEAMNSRNELYGDARLEQLVKNGRELRSIDLVKRVITAATEFAGHTPQSDDMTCLTLVYGGAP
jgi:serine phosphatase RsbU (regulator of sigma subunit)/CRP-like cAMP-binding protein